MADENNPHYPLRWPAGWPRTPAEERRPHSSFKASSEKTRRGISDEIRKLGGTDPVICSNVAVRQDGTPYADQARRKITDPGVAVWFQMRGKTKSMARDAFACPEDNIRDIYLALRDMRMLELHGGSMMVERAFEGFTALPPPETCWQILGITGTRTRQTVLASFRVLAVAAQSGNAGDMDRLVKARDAALAEIGS